MKNKRKQRRQKILYSILIVLFLILNYTIIAYGHSITYNLEDNNCTHMSKQLEHIIEHAGIPVTLRTGGCDDGSRHMWIKLWGWLELDSVNLLPVINTEYNQHIVEYENFGEYRNER